MVGDHMSRYSAWSNTIQKVHGRLSRWKVKTLSIGGRLTLLKSVLGAVPIYNMSLYKAPKCVLNELERLRNNFFKGGDSQDSKITWVAWANVLSSKKNRGLGLSSFFALNRALLLKRVWRYLVQDRSLWFSVGVSLSQYSLSMGCYLMRSSSVSFERRQVRYGVERNQWSALLHMLGTITLSSSPDRWVKLVPIKVNIFAWSVGLGRLPTRGNLVSRGVTLDFPLCPICELSHEDSSQFFFSCELGKSISQRICRWWNIQWEEVSSFVDWFTWFGSIRLPSKLKAVLEGVFYSAWWHV
nr:RNA-directed DNA polymerase, eukaryota [Tanacetum cinerariifolium]